MAQKLSLQELKLCSNGQVVRKFDIAIRVVVQRLEALRVEHIVDTQPTPHRTIGIAEATITLLCEDILEILCHLPVDIRAWGIVQVTTYDMAMWCHSDNLTKGVDVVNTHTRVVGNALYDALHVAAISEDCTI